MKENLISDSLEALLFTVSIAFVHQFESIVSNAVLAADCLYFLLLMKS